MIAPDAPTITLRLPDGRALAALRVPDEAFDARPLMPALGPDDALAYLFARPRRAHFWTLGFEVRVDQVFVAAGGRVVQVLAARDPDDATLLGPETDVALVLELAAGTAHRLGLAPGAVLPVLPVLTVLTDAPGAPSPAASPASNAPFIAITQADRAGWFLACELRERGYRIVHVHHTHHLNEVGEDQFDVELVYGDDLDHVLPALRELGPQLVLAGSELGVNAADYLAESLGLPGNGTALSVARRHKAGMVEALRAAGIAVMRQVRARGWKRIARWRRHFGLAEIVIKPVRSAGTDRVSSARDDAGVRRAVRAIIGATNRLGLAETEVVAQERLVGPEIYLNSVSRDGRHAVTEIWLETKRPARGAPDSPFAYDTFQLLPGDDVLARYLGAWLARVLDALGVRWGPAHTELILTPDGPRLIDFGARLDGVLLPALNDECLGRSPVALTADAWLDPAAWEAWAAAPYRLRKHATMVVVDNPCAGILRDDSGLRRLAALPTFHALRPRWEVGEPVPATRDAFSYHAIVTLRDEDPERVRADLEHIRRLEAAELLLDVTPRAPAEAEPAARYADPRAGAAWGRALAALGWRTLSDPPSGLVARVREALDGPLVWVPRQGRAVPLAALERLRESTAATRVLVEVDGGTTFTPLVGEPLVVERWDATTEAALERLGLTPTMHAQAPAELVRLAPSDVPPPGVTLVEAPAPAAVADAFAALGPAAAWPVALATEAHTVLVVSGPAAALAVRDAATLHVAVVSAHGPDELEHLARALATLGPVVVPAELPDTERLRLPPTLRWARPRWAAHLDDADALFAAIAGHATAPPPSSSSSIASRTAALFAAREHPLSTWDGGLYGQATGRDPWWAATAMLFRALPSEAAHATAARARTIDLRAFAALGEKHEILWIGWEPPGGLCRVTDRDGHDHELDFTHAELALDLAARLDLVPVRARWTARAALVTALTPALAAPPPLDAAITAAAAVAEATWSALSPARPGASLFAARSYAALVADAWLAVSGAAWALGVLHDRVMWILADSSDSHHAMLALAHHARARGADLLAADAPRPRPLLRDPGVGLRHSFGRLCGGQQGRLRAPFSRSSADDRFTSNWTRSNSDDPADARPSLGDDILVKLPPTLAFFT